MLLAAREQWHLNNEKIKNKKRIHRSSLTIKYKEKQLEYARQYQTKRDKEWWKVIFLDEKKFNLDGPEVLARKKCSRRELLNKA